MFRKYEITYILWSWWVILRSKTIIRLEETIEEILYRISFLSFVYNYFYGECIKQIWKICTKYSIIFEIKWISMRCKGWTRWTSFENELSILHVEWKLNKKCIVCTIFTPFSLFWELIIPVEYHCLRKS